MKYAFLLLIFFTDTNEIFCQSSSAKNGIDSLLNAINNNSVLLRRAYVWELELDSNSTRLVKLKSKYLVNKLIEALDDTTKTIVSHVILSKIFDKKSSYLTTKTPSDENRIVFEFTYNGFSWKETNNMADTSLMLSFDHSQIQKLKRKWGRYKSKKE